MKLLNFSIGQVCTVRIGSEQVRTAHLKSPVAEPWIITEDGPLGDERAVHPDKIYAYAHTGYEHWAAELAVDRSTWPDGTFAENLTFDVLDEDDLRIGDVFELGEEVRLVVAGPRNPCLKLTWRLNQPLTFQKIFQLSHRTGVYFGVLRPGRVKPHDIAMRVEQDASMPTVAEVAQFAAGHTVPPLGPLQRVLAFKHLSGTVRHILNAKLDAAQRAAATRAGRWKGWRDFTIAHVVEEAPGIRSFNLRPADGKSLCRSKAGQFVTVRLPGTDGQPITRCWSLSAYTHAPDHYRLTVRRQCGPGSSWLHDATIGSTVELRAPSGDFVLDAGGFLPVVLVAAGIGVTPLLAMLHAHLARGNTGIPVYLIYGARTPAAVAFRQELESLAAKHPSLHITYVYSASDAAGRAPGRITVDLLMGVFEDLHLMLGTRRVPLAWYETDTYLCGPGVFCLQMRDQLVARGANADHIFFESFAVPPQQSTDLESAVINFNRSRRRATWRVEEDLTLLDLAESAGVDIPNDCRAGACLSCKTRVVQGTTTADLGDGHALLCISRPRTATVDLDC
jgi:ferredoxin-NADP reductase/MOSC domain-containing protein YiiM